LVETTMPENQCRFWLCLNFSEEDSCVCILYLWIFRFVWFRKMVILHVSVLFFVCS
jgi:hypothetical protein